MNYTITSLESEIDQDLEDELDSDLEDEEEPE